MKTEIFTKILAVVSETTEVPAETIRSKVKTEECVAARALFVHFCCAKGVPTCAIRDYLCRKRNDCVTHSHSAYYSFHRTSCYFRALEADVERKLSPSPTQASPYPPTTAG